MLKLNISPHFKKFSFSFNRIQATAPHLSSTPTPWSRKTKNWKNRNKFVLCTEKLLRRSVLNTWHHASPILTAHNSCLLNVGLFKCHSSPTNVINSPHANSEHSITQKSFKRHSVKFKIFNNWGYNYLMSVFWKTWKTVQSSCLLILIRTFNWSTW